MIFLYSIQLEVFLVIKLSASMASKSVEPEIRKIPDITSNKR